MNGILAQTSGGTRNKSRSKGGCEEAKKYGSIIYHVSFAVLLNIKFTIVLIRM